MADFARLRDAVNDDATLLSARLDTDSELLKLSRSVAWSAWSLKEAERRHRPLYIAPVDPAFITAWRTFESRYEGTVSRFHIDLSALDDLAEELGELVKDGVAPRRTPLKELWDDADYEARQEAKALLDMVDFAEGEASQDTRDFDEVYRRSVLSGAGNLYSLFTNVGLDIVGIFRRRRLVPVVLVPRHVSNAHSPSDLISLFTLLQQAQEAYVVGLHLACLAMLRSVMETTLRRHYGAEGDELRSMIDSSLKLPSGANKVALHKIRKLANEALHGDGKRERMPADIELGLLWFFVVIRELVEGAPR